MRARVWLGVFKVSVVLRDVLVVVRDYAWDHYWYGPHGVGTYERPACDPKNVKPISFRDAWNARHRMEG